MCKFHASPSTKEGTYTVKVDKESGAGDPLSYVSQVVVQDFLIVSLGDSLASGEGNPPYSDHTCDVSTEAYGAQVAGKLEDNDPRSSVTFVQLACSGATIDSNVTGLPALYAPAAGLEKAKAYYAKMAHLASNSIGRQLIDLKEAIGDRQIDGLTISIGINNLEFGSVVAQCVVYKRCQDPPKKYGSFTLTDDLGKQVPANVAALGKLYTSLHSVIASLFPRKQLDPQDVFVVGYPDPLHDETGALCPVFVGTPKVGAFQNLDGEDEVTWAEQAFMGPLGRRDRPVRRRLELRPAHGRLREARLLQLGDLVQPGPRLLGCAADEEGSEGEHESERDPAPEQRGRGGDRGRAPAAGEEPALLDRRQGAKAVVDGPASAESGRASSSRIPHACFPPAASEPRASAARTTSRSFPM